MKKQKKNFISNKKLNEPEIEGNNIIINLKNLT